MADIDNQDPIVEQVKSAPPLDTSQSDAAIDDIVAQDADNLLAAEDANLAAQIEDLNDDPERPRGHPIFWFVVAFFAILALFGGYLLLSPGLSFGP